MIRELGLLAVGWLPLWAFAILSRQKLRPGRLVMGGALAGFVGGMCSAELRRHGLLAEPAGAMRLFLLDLHLDEVLHFAFLGAAAALILENLLDRAGVGEAS